MIKISPERIRGELTALLCGDGVGEALKNSAEELAEYLPEIVPMFGFEQRNPHHDRDVWQHTAAVVAAIRPEPELRWAALLHDIGKPGCFSLGQDGTGHFYGHAKYSVDIARKILDRLEFEPEPRERILHLIRYHDMPIAADREQIKRLLNKHGETVLRQLIELHRADTMGQSPLCSPRLREFAEIDVMIRDILAEPPEFTVRDLAIDGNDLMALGFSGRDIGSALRKCLDAVLSGKAENDHDALVELVRK